MDEQYLLNQKKQKLHHGGIFCFVARRVLRFLGLFMLQLATYRKAIVLPFPGHGLAMSTGPMIWINCLFLLLEGISILDRKQIAMSKSNLATDPGQLYLVYITGQSEIIQQDCFKFRPHYSSSDLSNQDYGERETAFTHASHSVVQSGDFQCFLYIQEKERRKLSQLSSE